MTDWARKLQVLAEKHLCVINRAADTLAVDFGMLNDLRQGAAGEYSLHIRCPWRLDGPAGVITGHGDLHRDVRGRDLPASWDQKTPPTKLSSTHI